MASSTTFLPTSLVFMLKVFLFRSSVMNCGVIYVLSVCYSPSAAGYVLVFWQDRNNTTTWWSNDKRTVRMSKSHVCGLSVGWVLALHDAWVLLVLRLVRNTQPGLLDLWSRFYKKCLNMLSQCRKVNSAEKGNNYSSKVAHELCCFAEPWHCSKGWNTSAGH